MDGLGRIWWYWLLATAGALAALGLATQRAEAGTVSYYHDFLGGICVREVDLEAAYAEGGKGVRPPPLCLETPCTEELTRDVYDRDILGRPATDAEWEDYQEMWALVCTSPNPSDVLTQLLPADPGPLTVILAAAPMLPQVIEDLIGGGPAPIWPVRWTPPPRGPNRPPAPILFPPSQFPPFGGFGGGGGGSSQGGGKTGGSTGGGGTGGPAGGETGLSEAPLSEIPLPPALPGALAALALLGAMARRTRPSG